VRDREAKLIEEFRSSHDEPRLVPARVYTILKASLTLRRSSTPAYDKTSSHITEPGVVSFRFIQYPLEMLFPATL
jgi:hypothetical protein